MKKNLLYLLILILLAVALVFINRSKREAARQLTDMDFTVTDPAIVERIVLTDKKGKADLRREADHWKVNGKFRVMQPRMDVLLETLQKVAVKSPVPISIRAEVMKGFETDAVKVEIYRKGEEQPFRVYYVDGNTNDSKGTYMLMELNGKKAVKPYIMHIPGFTGILDVRYFTDETEWRDTNIFDYSMEDIKQISVQYPMNPENSFSIIVISEDSFEVRPSGKNAAPATGIYKEGVVKYLSSFENLNAEAFDNDNPKRDSIMNATPFVSIMITEKSAYSRQMAVYHMPLNKRSKTQFDQQGNRLPYDLDRYYASINGGKDFVIIQDFVFGKIFRKFSDFKIQSTHG